MFIGCIVNDNHPCLKTIKESEISTHSQFYPVLIVGASKALELFPNLDLSTKTISTEKKIYYCYSFEEANNKYYEYVDNFIINCIEIFKKEFKIIKLLSIKELPELEEGFIYENNYTVSIVSDNIIYYLNKSISLFFNNLVNLETYKKKVKRIISWDYYEYFPAFLKANNLYKSKNELLKLYKPFLELNVYFSALCYKHLQSLDKTDELITPWMNAYEVEHYLSEVSIKTDVEKIKLYASDKDNVILQNIYENLIEDCLVQQCNGTDKLTGRIYPINNSYSLQSLSKPFRDIIIAEPKCLLVEFDYKYFEYNILAQLCNINLLKDPHLEMSEKLFGEGADRKLGKGINYALIYGKALPVIVSELVKEYGLEKSKVKDIIYETNKPIIELKNKLEKEFKEKGYIINIFNKKIYPDKEHACLNNYIQSIAACILIIKILKIKKHLINYSTINKIVLQNHDSLLLNFLEKDIDNTYIVKEVKTILEGSENNLINKVDLKYGYNWKELN